MNILKKVLKNKENEVPSVENAKILKYVKLGVPESEKEHEGLFTWGEAKDHVSSNYGGASYFINAPKKTFVRNYAGQAGVKFVFDESIENASLLVQIMIHDIPYEIGMMKHANKETTVRISNDGEEWKSIGSYLLSYEDKLTTVRLPIENYSGNILYVMLDNMENIESGENHYGQSIHFIGVYKKE